ncbi:MAG: LptF/LptG family permease [Planctomycetota bacterium]|jgi:lipopolysaccharide export LptBFGC system permease protein LptF
MVFTLHRYIFREAFRVFVLATVALTLILSLGSILRPVQEYGVGPRQVVHLMGYSLPITLTFVLPIAALFAATLVYGRFAADNELDACRASGVSLLTLLYPGLALAIMVATANLLLSFHVVPAFVQRAEKSFKADAKQILFRNIQRRGFYDLDGKFLIYADHADLKNDTLTGVVIAKLKGSKIEDIIIAERAKVRFNSRKRFNEVQITASNIYQIGFDTEKGFDMELLSVTKEFPPLMGDNIKFKKIDEMKKIEVDLMRFYPIAKKAHEVYTQFTAELLAQDISEKTANRANVFYELHSGKKFVGFTAAKCSALSNKKVELSEDVVIREYDSLIESNQIRKRLLRTLRCSRALLHIEGEEFEQTLVMEMYSPTWQKPNGEEGVVTGRPRIRGLILPKAVTDRFETRDLLKAVSPAKITSALQKEPSSKLAELQGHLQRRITMTLIEIRAEVHSRLVLGIGCVAMILIGVGLGIIKKEGHLLSAFGISVIPSAVLIACIMSGIQIAKNADAKVGSGIALMWAGLIFLYLLAAAIYYRLLRN